MFTTTGVRRTLNPPLLGLSVCNSITFPSNNNFQRKLQFQKLKTE